MLARLRQMPPEILLYLIAAAVPLSFATWRALLNNFAIEEAGFDGIRIGTLQSLREVPGFLAFGAVFLLAWMREQTLAVLSLLALGVGTALTGFLPTVWGLYFTTVLMSLGFHYAETMQQSLSMQLISKERMPEVLGKQIAVGSFTGLFVFGLLWLLLDQWHIDYVWIYLVGGLATALLAVIIGRGFPHFRGEAEQHKHLVLRKQYSLYYALTFLAGARRQIFVVFAGFLMVEKFGYSAADISALFLVNGALNIWLAPKIGRLVHRLGERRMLSIEYIGLILIFTAYAFVESAWIAALLYILDHLFFAMAIALKSYFKKIGDPADFASTAGVAFSINHIAAVVLPFLLGLLWMVSPAGVFLCGSAIAVLSLLLAQRVPRHPKRVQLQGLMAEPKS